MTAAQLINSFDDDPFAELAWTDFLSEDLNPSEEDYLTADFVHWYQARPLAGGTVGFGKLLLTTDPDEDYRPAVKRHMDRSHFWPTAWFISDHGNAHPLDLELD